MRKMFFICCLALWACQSNPTGSEQGIWQVVREASEDVYYSAIHFADRDNGWVVGDSGTILHTNNGGYSWEYQQSGTTNDFWDVHFIDRQTGWAAGANNTLLRTDDGGRSWQLLTVSGDTAGFFFAIYFADEQTGWAVSRGKVLRTLDGGTTWEAQTSWERGGAMICFVNSQVGYVRPVIDTVLLKTTDGGQHWSTLPMKSLRWETDLCFVDGQHGWVCNTKLPSSLWGDYANVFGTTDGGVTWTCLDTLTDVLHLSSIFFVDERLGWTAGMHYIFHTTDGGNTWACQFSPEDVYLGFRDIFFVDETYGWALGLWGGIVKYVVP